MKIITALESPKTNEKLKKETNFEIIGSDIQYQDGVIEVLEKHPEINVIIISELLPGQYKFKELIEKIKSINKEVEIISILKNENESMKNYLISKGVFNIFYNNKITTEELINKIKSLESIKKENEISEEIKTLKKMILEKNNEKMVVSKTNSINKKFKKIKNKILKNRKKETSIKKEQCKIISIVGTNGVGKSIFSSILAKTIKNKRVLLIDFDIFNQSINSIFNVKKKNEKSNDSIVKVSKNISLLCAVDFLFDGKYRVEKNKIRELLEDLSKKYDVIIIDTTSECFFDYTKEILKMSDAIMFLAQANLIELKKSKNLLDIYINKWNVEKEKINIIFNKMSINSIDNKILETLFSDFDILEKIKINDNFNLIINNNLKIIDKKIKKKFEKIIEKLKII